MFPAFSLAQKIFCIGFKGIETDTIPRYLHHNTVYRLCLRAHESKPAHLVGQVGWFIIKRENYSGVHALSHEMKTTSGINHATTIRRVVYTPEKTKSRRYRQ